MSYHTSLRRPNTSAPSDGSRTITITPTPADENEDPANGPNGSSPSTLRLRATPRKPRQRVVWREDVVDNEGAGKKSSKSTLYPLEIFPHSDIQNSMSPVCCIYHKPKAFDESSDEEDSDADSENACDHRIEHGHAHAHGHREGLQNRDSPTVEHIEHAEEQHNTYEILPSIEEGQTQGDIVVRF
ncbi:hypothetical protein D9757_015531 [Collybiopsis confluens]|uniref:Type 1 phosphatases regulator n=1 Tax=Collybiopsis confluens TaxID=2823264 RepID=A0A8H5C2H2_9AGAR|nr:hypothetical protein D9757_015531 [Collybiopsis confluens]